MSQRLVMRCLLGLLVSACLCLSMAASASGRTATTVRQDILLVLQQLQAGLNQTQALESDLFAPDVLVTLHHGVILHGWPQVQSYLQRLLKGDAVVLSVFSTHILPDFSMTVLPSGAVLHGQSLDHYVFSDGLDFHLTSYWSMSLTRSDSAWQIQSLHVSANVFENPLLVSSNEGMKFAGTAGFLLGLAASWIFYRTLRRQLTSRYS